MNVANMILVCLIILNIATKSHPITNNRDVNAMVAPCSTLFEIRVPINIAPAEKADNIAVIFEKKDVLNISDGLITACKK